METRIEKLSRIVKNKTILDIGFANAEDYNRKILNKSWLHSHLKESASFCVGYDINKKVVEELIEKGYDHIYYNIDDIPDIEWDHIILGEVIEHISNPVSFLNNIKNNFKFKSIIITTPNAFSLKNFINCFFNKEEINQNHMYWYTPFTIKKIIFESEIIDSGIYKQGFIESYKRGIFHKIFLSKFPMFKNTIFIEIIE